MTQKVFENKDRKKERHGVGVGSYPGGGQSPSSINHTRAGGPYVGAYMAFLGELTLFKPFLFDSSLV